MGLFSKKSKVQEEHVMSEIKVLGPGCNNCATLKENTRAALADMNNTEGVEHVSDYADIAKFGVMSTPGLVVDGTVLSQGRVLKKEEIIELINHHRGTK